MRPQRAATTKRSRDETLGIDNSRETIDAVSAGDAHTFEEIERSHECPRQQTIMVSIPAPDPEREGVTMGEVAVFERSRSDVERHGTLGGSRAG